MNPYWGKTFFTFFVELFLRLTGWRDDIVLAPDEIQVFTLIGIAVSSALIGSLLFLRKMTMLANALSHTILLGIVITFLFIRMFSEGAFEIDIPTMFVASLLTALLTTFFTFLLKNTFFLKEDASISLVFSALFALGIILVTVFTKSSHIGTEIVMGNVDALHINDLKLVSSILLLNILLFVLFYKEYLITTFDPLLSKAIGISPLIFNYLLMLQTSWAIIAAFRAVGVLLVLTFLVGPVITARLFTHEFKKMVLIAALVGVLASLIGVALSRHLLTVFHLSLSTAGLTVTVIGALYLSSLAYHKIVRKVRLTSPT